MVELRFKHSELKRKFIGFTELKHEFKFKSESNSRFLDFLTQLIFWKFYEDIYLVYN